MKYFKLYEDFSDSNEDDEEEEEHYTEVETFFDKLKNGTHFTINFNRNKYVVYLYDVYSEMDDYKGVPTLKLTVYNEDIFELENTLFQDLEEFEVKTSHYEKTITLHPYFGSSTGSDFYFIKDEWENLKIYLKNNYSEFEEIIDTLPNAYPIPQEAIDALIGKNVLNIILDEIHTITNIETQGGFSYSVDFEGLGRMSLMDTELWNLITKGITTFDSKMKIVD